MSKDLTHDGQLALAFRFPYSLKWIIMTLFDTGLYSSKHVSKKRGSLVFLQQVPIAQWL